MSEESVRQEIYLAQVYLKGFRSIEDLTVNFQKGLNVIIGKNGSGKSNFMELVFQASSRFHENKVPFDYAKLEFRDDNNHSFTFENERVFRKFHLENSAPDERFVLAEKFYIDNDLKFDSSSDDSITRLFSFGDKTILYSTYRGLLFNKLGYIFFTTSYLKYHIPEDLYFISAPGRLDFDIDNPYLEYDATITLIRQIMWELEGSFDLARHSTNQENSAKNIELSNILKMLKVDHIAKENLKKYTPIEDIRFNNNVNIYTEGKRIIIENIRLEFKINQSWMPWSYLSDGTKRLFYLISEITSTGGLVLIEEPELGIHPHQFSLLMDFLKEQAETKQIVISTHSPKALDHFSEKELDRILICSYDLKKGTQIRHLSSKEVNKAKKYMKEVGFFSDYWLLSDLE